MSIQIRNASERGTFDHGWLKTHHTFSFADYQDPAHVHFRALRVINEDFVAAGAGFPTHPHHDMEIITVILDGELQHKDSMGNGSVIRPGDVQRMSAGTGVTHSEFNPSKINPTHLLQIWIFPDKKNHAPSYEQKRFEPAQRKNRLCLAASSDGAEGSVTIHQDARLYLSTLTAGDALEYALKAGRYAWLQMIRGELALNGQALHPSDGVAVSGEKAISLKARSDAEFLLFDLA